MSKKRKQRNFTQKAYYISIEIGSMQDPKILHITHNLDRVDVLQMLRQCKEQNLKYTFWWHSHHSLYLYVNPIFQNRGRKYKSDFKPKQPTNQ